MKKLKTTLLTKLFILISLFASVYSCNIKDSKNDQLSIANTQGIHLTYTESDSLTLQTYFEILRLATIELTQNSHIRSIINDSLILEQYNDRLSYTNLRLILLNRYNEKLKDIMQLSMANNGANTGQIDALENIMDSFNLGGNLYRPLICVLRASDINLPYTKPILGKAWINPIDSVNFIDYNDSNKTCYVLSESKDITTTNQCWMINFRVKDESKWKLWAPASSCACKPDCCGIPLADQGRCDGDLGKKCTRASYSGGCPQEKCSVKSGTYPLPAIFN